MNILSNFISHETIVCDDKAIKINKSNQISHSRKKKDLKNATKAIRTERNSF